MASQPAPDGCDGGRTFTGLAKALRPLTDGQVKLYAIHETFSQGLDTLQPVLGRIYVANPFPASLPDFVQTV